ncbi:hypothetical protein Naga_100876g2 [Nannochloropsis gaditana]|uniref:Uncharacterized protein n=1 Tax=Nannochloropsis gaditana TaxID=72520 RepID=W7T1U6_9STRA|nr:hypothetical protein Naga_100876g2 [Nannochloropsis gaditana]
MPAVWKKEAWPVLPWQKESSFPPPAAPPPPPPPRPPSPLCPPSTRACRPPSLSGCSDRGGSEWEERKGSGRREGPWAEEQRRIPRLQGCTWAPRRRGGEGWRRRGKRREGGGNESRARGGGWVIDASKMGEGVISDNVRGQRAGREQAEALERERADSISSVGGGG